MSNTPGTPGHRSSPVATAAALTGRPYITGTITRTSTGEARAFDSRWTSRQIAWCQQNYGSNPDDLLITGTSIQNARLMVSAATFVVFWALAGIPQRLDNSDFEQLLDLRQDEVMAEFVPDFELIAPGGDGEDPTVPAGSDG